MTSSYEIVGILRTVKSFRRFSHVELNVFFPATRLRRSVVTEAEITYRFENRPLLAVHVGAPFKRCWNVFCSTVFTSNLFLRTG